jgi:hypothetical protein
MVLKKSMLGRLVQYSPLNEGDKKELRKDIFFIHILVFSEDGGLMKKFLEIPPDWLKKIGEESEQREHLRKKVLINIYERFEFIKHKEFEGFLLYVGNK